MPRALLCLTFVGLVYGCTPKGEAEVEPAAVSVTDERSDLLFVWIDEHGETHVETQASSVPAERHDYVRVIDPKAAPSERIVLVTLGAKQPDGTYPTRTVSRDEFEAVVLARRQAQGAATLPSAGVAVRPAPAPPSQGQAVVLYGAEWCGACHQAAAWMRKKGIAFVEKDIEKDPAAGREMRDKLQRAGLPRGSIPVLDVRGRMQVGFSPSAVEAALGKGA